MFPPPRLCAAVSETDWAAGVHAVLLTPLLSTPCTLVIRETPNFTGPACKNLAMQTSKVQEQTTRRSTWTLVLPWVLNVKSTPP